MQKIRYNTIVPEKVQSSEHPADVIWEWNVYGLRSAKVKWCLCGRRSPSFRIILIFKMFWRFGTKNNVFMMSGGAYRLPGIGFGCTSGRRGAAWITRWTWDFLQAFRGFVRRGFRSCLMEKSARLKTGTRCFIGKMGDFLNENMSMSALPRLIFSGYHWHEEAGIVKICKKS